MSKKSKWPSYWGHSLFCDEVRKEITGKDIYVGVYSTGMTVHAEYPYTHPHMSIVVTYSEDINIESTDVKVSIFPPGEDEPIGSLTIPAHHIEEVKELARNDDTPIEGGGQRQTKIQFVANLTPMKVSSDGRLRVRGYRDGEEIKMGTLNIMQTPEIKSGKENKGKATSPEV